MKRYIRTAVTNVSDEDIYSRRELASSTANVYLLDQLSEDIDPEIRCLVAANPNTPTDILIKLASDSMPRVPEFLFMREAPLPLEVQKAIAYNCPGLRKLLLEYENVDTEIIEILSNDELYYIREKAATKSRLSDESKIRLSNDSDRYVRYALSKNSKLPLEAIRNLSKDPYDYTRLTIAGRKDVPADILDDLSFDEFPNVRLTVAFNQQTPISTLERMLNDSDEEVRHFAKNNISSRI